MMRVFFRGGFSDLRLLLCGVVATALIGCGHHHQKPVIKILDREKPTMNAPVPSVTLVGFNFWEDDELIYVNVPDEPIPSDTPSSTIGRHYKIVGPRVPTDPSDPAQEYDLITGTRAGTGTYVQAEVNAFESNLTAGWMIFGGGYPMGRTSVVRAAGQGTRMAICVRTGAFSTHRVYNLSPEGSGKVVNTERPNGAGAACVPAQHYIDYNALIQGTPEPISATDPFKVLADKLVKKVPIGD